MPELRLVHSADAPSTADLELANLQERAEQDLLQASEALAHPRRAVTPELCRASAIRLFGLAHVLRRQRLSAIHPVEILAATCLSFSQALFECATAREAYPVGHHITLAAWRHAIAKLRTACKACDLWLTAEEDAGTGRIPEAFAVERVA